MKKVIVVLSFIISNVLLAQVSKVKKITELSGFNNPESIIKDENNNVIYVSNVNGNPTDKDSNGYISKVSVDGKMITQKWIEGLHAPKGMVISNGKLFVADINDIVEIDIKSSIVLHRYTAEGATF